MASSLPNSVNAGDYGRGAYGECKLQTGCPQPPPPTIVETKTELQVAINLSNGQIIPADGYTVTVTPLNGQGRSFERINIYIGGNFITSVLPDSTGTARWFWDPSRNSGTHIRVDVIDTDGSVVTREFDVTIGTNSTGTTTPPQTGRGAVSQLLDPIERAAQFVVENVIRFIPQPIAVSIPYALIGILLLLAIALLLLSQRELAGLRRARRHIARSKQLAEQRDGFLMLTSHYLRTPFTIIQGGVDMLKTIVPPLDSTLMARLVSAIQSFHDAIETLLMAPAQNTQLQAIARPGDIPPIRSVWSSPVFLIPTISVGVLLVIIDYLLIRADKISGSVILLLTQAAIYIAMVVGFYMSIRAYYLHRRDNEFAQQEEAQQVALDQARNNLVSEGAETLTKNFENIRVLLPSLPPTNSAVGLMNEGANRITELLKRFRATATVSPPVTSMPFKPFRFSQLLTQARATVAEQASAKGSTIVQTSEDTILASQQPAWITQVLSSLLDNAIAYSAQGSRIEVSAKRKGNQAVLTVKDFGAGIPKEKLQELFQPFSKVEGAMQFDHPGLGLSLYLDRLLITNLGGNIQIDSKPQQGTLVTISFPVEQ